MHRQVFVRYSVATWLSHECADHVDSQTEFNKLPSAPGPVEVTAICNASLRVTVRDTVQLHSHARHPHGQGDGG